MYFLQVLYSSSLVDINVVPFGAWLAALLAVFMLLLSAFASGSEIAFFSLSPNDVNALDPDRSAKDKSIEMLRDDNERTLATILIANNFVNVMIIMLLNYFFSRLITFKAAWLEMLCITVLLTFLLLLFGEIMPKVFSRQAPLRYCRFAVNGILLLRKVFWPLETVLIRSGAFAERVVQKESRQLSVDELEQALELTDKNDIKNEQSMLQGIIRFGDETAKEVMTRARISSISRSTAATRTCSSVSSTTTIRASPSIRTTRTTSVASSISRTCCPISPSPRAFAGRVSSVLPTSCPRPR